MIQNKRENYLIEALDRKGPKTDIRPWAVDAVAVMLEGHPDPKRAVAALLAALAAAGRRIDPAFTSSKLQALSRQELPKRNAAALAAGEALFRKVGA